MRRRPWRRLSSAGAKSDKPRPSHGTSGAPLTRNVVFGVGNRSVSLLLRQSLYMLNRQVVRTKIDECEDIMVREGN